jgi:hypothetical protein
MKLLGIELRLHSEKPEVWKLGDLIFSCLAHVCVFSSNLRRK